jgi:adenine-specific DNA-methyltransferase
MQQLDGKSMDIVSDNIEKLRELFPEVFSEGKIDFKKLEEELGQIIDPDTERYNFTWAGKTEAKRIAQTPSTGTLRPSKEDSKNWDTTQNLYIEGDNLEVLKLLQKSYHKKVKMIYIDPPYNTGKDFVYKDNFHDNIQNYLEITGQVDSDGKKLSANAETNGRYHSDWLDMMYPRLKLARNLLRDDGVIFISIDDNEVSNLRKLCDEIFGEDNFVANFLWKKKGTTSNVEGVEVSAQVDSTLCYKKTSIQSIYQRVTSKETRTHPFTDDEGDYRLVVIEKKDSGAYKRDTMKFPILGHVPREGKRWQIGIETAKELEEKNRFVFDGEKIKLKIYSFEEIDTTSAQPNLLDSHGTTDTAAKLVNETLFNISELFDNPKPIELITHLIRISSQDDTLILDFFSGSATTAHAVMQLNNEDSGNRKYIMVQLPEATDEKSEAYKAGYKNICEIGKERIRRAGDKIIADNPDKDLSGLDIGFKVLKLDSSNIKAWDSDFDNLETNLLDAVDNIKSGRNSEDLLYEVLLKYGLDLTLPIEEKSINGSKIFVIGFGALIVCLDDRIALETVNHIAKLKGEYESEITRVVFKDSSFADAVVKTNALQTLKQFGIDEVVSI